MVYQGKPSAGCQNCRKRKIKVCSRNRFIYPTRSLSRSKPPSHHLVSATRLSQPALNASIQRENALATLLVSTLCYVTKPKPSGGRPNGRSSYRTKRQNFPHRLIQHLPTNPCQRHGPLSTPEETLPVLWLNAIPPRKIFHACSTISQSNRPFVRFSSTLYSCLAIRIVPKAISNTCYHCTLTLVPTRRYHWLLRLWL